MMKASLTFRTALLLLMAVAEYGTCTLCLSLGLSVSLSLLLRSLLA